jgi:hypothetical protein
MASDWTVPRTKYRAQSSADWVADRFGPPHPDFIEIPWADVMLADYPDEIDEDKAGAFFKKWGPVIEANSAALKKYYAECDAAAKRLPLILGRD